MNVSHLTSKQNSFTVYTSLYRHIFKNIDVEKYLYQAKANVKYARPFVETEILVIDLQNNLNNSGFENAKIINIH